MSKETTQWLNTMVLVGATDKRGKAWHYRADSQTPWDYTTDEGELVVGIGNHYPGGIPMQDVRYRLFNWEPLTSPVYYLDSNEDGTVDVKSYHEIPNQQRVYPSDDPSHTFWIAKDSYVPHPYDDSLLGGVADLLDTNGDDLIISSAGLLAGRAIGWVEVSVPDSITTPEGIEFRPNLLATTSLNGSLATTYKRTCTNTVCDNTMAIALSEEGQSVKVRHSKYSNLRLADAREALAIIHTTADEISAEFAELCRIDVTDAQFFNIVKEMTAPPKGKDESKMGNTLREKKTGELSQLWRNDNRVTPWANTGFGVLQAFNTWEQHFKGTRGATTAAERNMLATIKGDIETADRKVYATMMNVLSNA